MRWITDIIRNRVEHMIIKGIKNGNIKFVDKDNLIYKNPKSKVVQTLTYAQFADSLIARSPEEMAAVGMTRDNVVESLRIHYIKNGGK